MGLQSKVHKPDGSKEVDFLSFICGNCGRNVSGSIVAFYPNNSHAHIKWLLCPACLRGSVSNYNIISPHAQFGNAIQGLPTEINSAYEEARRCMSVNAFTASELICRKILMHIAVDKGANENARFAEYITYLENQGFITPSIKSWADMIRTNGNESTHELKEPTKERAEMTIMFTAQLLIIIYQMEHFKNQYLSSTASPTP